jgi:hypothetical protein
MSVVSVASGPSPVTANNFLRMMSLDLPSFAYVCCMPPSGYGNEFTAGGTCYKLISSVTWSAAMSSCKETDG